MATSPEQGMPSSELPAGARGPETGTESPETGLESPEGGQDLESTEEGEPSLAERQEDLAEERQELAEDQERVQEEVKEIEELREALDVPEGSQQESVSERMLKERQEKLERRSEALGRELLGAPEGEPDDVEDPDEAESMELEGMELDAKLDEEGMQRERQELIDQYIADSTKQVLKELKPYLDESQNGARVAGMLKLQIEAGVRSVAKDYVESGDGAEDIAFTASISRAHYDTDDGRKTFVTDFKIVMGDSTERVPADAMSDADRGELGQAERDPDTKVDRDEGGSGKK